MIDLSVSVSDTPSAVLLSAHTDAAEVTFYRRVGLTDEQLIASVPVENGVATHLDTAPPEKALLSYAAVSDAWERSRPATAVLPVSWSLTRPTLAGDIRLGDMILNTIDDQGTVWTVSDIDGWWTLPESEVPFAVRSRDEDGSYDDDGRFLARRVVLSGVFLPKNPDFLESARSRLVTAIDAVRRTTALRVDETPSRRMFVRLTGKTMINTVRQSGLTEFAVELTAPDPVKYSLDPIMQPSPNQLLPVVIKGGTPNGGRLYPRFYEDGDSLREYGQGGDFNAAQAHNRGNYPTQPTLTITGPVTNPKIQLIETGEVMEFIITLQTGQYLEISTKEKTVLLNGAQSRRGTMTFPSSWFSLQPGINTIRYTSEQAPNNFSTATLEAYSAWIG